MDRLFITCKDRPTELTILCKSLLHSDMRHHINEVVFLDDHSEDSISIARIFGAFSYIMTSMGIRTRLLEAKDGRNGINDSWSRIRYYGCDRAWLLNGDMMVFSNYFERCRAVLDYGEDKFKNKSIIVSGFNTPFHPPITNIPQCNAIQVANVGGCSEVFYWKNLDNFLSCLRKPDMNRGWDLHMGEVFDYILVTNPTVSQHLGFFTGLNQISLAGFPGAFATVRG